MKSASERFYHIFSSLWWEINGEINLLLICQILGCFLTHWLPMARILFKILEFSRSYFKPSYLKSGKLFLNFSFNLWNLHQILNILKEKMVVIANVIPKLENVKDLVRRLNKKSRFRTTFDSQNVKQCPTLVKSAWEHFYHVFSSL